jgi:hypothetical protein
MPACFHLIRKADQEAGPVSLVKVDEEMARHFGHEPHPKHWFYAWFDMIGFRIALGRTPEYIRDAIKEEYADEPDCRDMLLKIIDWLEANFINDCRYQRGRVS